ncbi:MAG: hypothetical protein HY898_11450 [Deltaproteobacteria bacterium]|nr:hypothetical protein [Deltaproteobacteria bacterium]
MRRFGKSAGVVFGVLCAAAVTTAASSAQAKTSWTQVHQEMNQGNSIMALTALDATHAWALGQKSSGSNTEMFALGTTDGATWVTVGLPVGYQLMMPLTLAFADPNNGWMGGFTGKGGRVWRTTDGGSSWSEALPTGQEIPVHMQAFTSGQMYAVGSNYVVAYDGQQYQKITVEPASGLSLKAVSMLNPTCGYVLAAADTDSAPGSALYWTNDSGATWTQQGATLDYNLVRMSWVSKNLGWAAGAKGGAGIVARTTDAGATWTAVSIPDHPPSGNMIKDPVPASDCFDVKFFDNNRGVATCVACTGGCDPDAGPPTLLTVFVRTEDGGQSWVMDPDYEAAMGGPFMKLSGLYFLAFPDPNHGFIAGTNNMVLRYVADTEEAPGWEQPTCEATGGGGNGSGGSGAGASNGAPGGASEDSGCGCHAAAAGATGFWLAAGLGLLALGRRRRR